MVNQETENAVVNAGERHLSPCRWMMELCVRVCLPPEMFSQTIFLSLDHQLHSWLPLTTQKDDCTSPDKDPRPRITPDP